MLPLVAGPVGFAHVDDSTAGYLSFHPIVQCVVHALKGLACHARVNPASSPGPASHCSASGAQRSRCLRFTHATVPVLLAHAEVIKT